MIIKIAVLCTDNNNVQRQVMKGLTSVAELVKPCAVDFKYFCTQSVEKRLVDNKIGEVLSYRPDVLIAVGDMCSKYAAEKLDDATLFPVVALAISDAAWQEVYQKQKGKQSRFTGVKACLPPKSIPLQILLMLQKNIQRFVFVYRQDRLDERVEYEIEKMEQYLTSHDRCHSRLPIPLTGNYEKLFLSEVKEGDGVVVVNASTRSVDASLLAKVCAEKKAFLFAEAENVIPLNALCGYSSDFEFIGRQGAIYIKKLVHDEVPISETPVYEFENASQITINNNTARAHGVELYDNQIKMFTTGAGKDFLLNLKFHYDFVLEQYSAFGRRLYEKLLRSSNRNAADNLLCEPVLHTNNYDEEEFTPHFCGQVVETNRPCVVVEGYKMACMLQREMLKTGKFKHMIIISFADEQLEKEPAKIKENKWPSSYRVMRLTLPAFDASSAVRLLRATVPEARSIGCVYSRDSRSIEPRLQLMLNEVQAECDEYGLSFMHDGGSDGEAFSKAREKLIEKCDAIITFPRSITVEQAKELSVQCHAHNRFLLSGDQGLNRVCSSLLNISLKNIVDTLWDTLMIAAHGGVLPPKLDAKISFRDAYAYQLDKSWFERRLKTIPENIESFVGVPIAKEAMIDHDDDNCDGGHLTMEEIIRRAQARTYKPKSENVSGFPGEVEEIEELAKQVVQINEKLFVWYGIIEKI